MYTVYNTVRCEPSPEAGSRGDPEGPPPAAQRQQAARGDWRGASCRPAPRRPVARGPGMGVPCRVKTSVPRELLPLGTLASVSPIARTS
jgi:hypothetical protein